MPVTGTTSKTAAEVDTAISTQESRGAGSAPRSKAPASKKRPDHEILNTVLFDSKGPRKYAVQLRRATNGNPCLKIIEGIPTSGRGKRNRSRQERSENERSEAEYRRVYLTVWSEDFDAFFKALGDTWRYIRDHEIKTPENHKTPKTIGRARAKNA